MDEFTKKAYETFMATQDPLASIRGTPSEWLQDPEVFEKARNLSQKDLSLRGLIQKRSSEPEALEEFIRKLSKNQSLVDELMPKDLELGKIATARPEAPLFQPASLLSGPEGEKVASRLETAYDYKGPRNIEANKPENILSQARPATPENPAPTLAGEGGERMADRMERARVRRAEIALENELRKQEALKNLEASRAARASSGFDISPQTRASEKIIESSIPGLRPSKFEVENPAPILRGERGAEYAQKMEQARELQAQKKQQLLEQIIENERKKTQLLENIKSSSEASKASKINLPELESQVSKNREILSSIRGVRPPIGEATNPAPILTGEGGERMLDRIERARDYSAQKRVKELEEQLELLRKGKAEEAARAAEEASTAQRLAEEKRISDEAIAAKLAEEAEQGKAAKAAQDAAREAEAAKLASEEAEAAKNAAQVADRKKIFKPSRNIDVSESVTAGGKPVNLDESSFLRRFINDPEKLKVVNKFLNNPIVKVGGNVLGAIGTLQNFEDFERARQSGDIMGMAEHGTGLAADAAMLTRYPPLMALAVPLHLGIKGGRYLGSKLDEKPEEKPEEKPQVKSAEEQVSPDLVQMARQQLYNPSEEKEEPTPSPAPEQMPSATPAQEVSPDVSEKASKEKSPLASVMDILIPSAGAAEQSMDMVVPRPGQAAASDLDTARKIAGGYAAPKKKALTYSKDALANTIYVKSLQKGIAPELGLGILSKESYNFNIAAPGVLHRKVVSDSGKETEVRGIGQITPDTFNAVNSKFPQKYMNVKSYEDLSNAENIEDQIDAALNVIKMKASEIKANPKDPSAFSKIARMYYGLGNPKKPGSVEASEEYGRDIAERSEYFGSQLRSTEKGKLPFTAKNVVYVAPERPEQKALPTPVSEPLPAIEKDPLEELRISPEEMQEYSSNKRARDLMELKALLMGTAGADIGRALSNIGRSIASSKYNVAPPDTLDEKGWESLKTSAQMPTLMAKRRKEMVSSDPQSFESRKDQLRYIDFLKRNKPDDKVDIDKIKSMSSEDIKEALDFETKFVKLEEAKTKRTVDWANKARNRAQKLAEQLAPVEETVMRINSIDPKSANAVQQIGAMYDLIKDLDKNSAVREGELELLKSIQPYSVALGRLYNKILGSGTINVVDEKTFKEIQQQINAIYKNSVKSYHNLMTPYYESAPAGYESGVGWDPYRNSRPKSSSASSGPSVAPTYKVGDTIKYGGEMYKVVDDSGNIKKIK